MSSQLSGAGGTGNIPRPGPSRSGSLPQGTGQSSETSAAQPPFDINNFPFTFEHVHDASHSARIEADTDPSMTASRQWDDESITSSVSAYREENGRTYHAYSDGSWHYPNDPWELERLDWQFVCLKRLFNDKNYFAPWTQQRPPRRILDIATGTGMWAIEVAEEFESATVIGTDLSPVQPELVPPNLHFYIHDARTNDWWWPDPFDYIHLRMTLGAWADFEQDVARKAFNHLEPNGWFEAQELCPSFMCDDDSMAPDYAPKLLFDDLLDCARAEQRPIDIAKTYKQSLINAGFVDVTEQVYKIPINGWPKQVNWKTLGDLWNANCLDGIQGIAMALLHRVRRLKRHQIEIHLMETRRALSDKRVHAYQKFYVVLGRKPRPDEMVTTPGATASASASTSNT
ncbi:Uu.00g097410.m01.CDS01 [Anthostomella pinea]|uniref:Uu.00g097410.m01.CDS01 n=1 Tax=Anthostomella pinea TaxID=933095 RepID=A0AAI8VD38_9PEZI|nr:Uu.00g097410.m01.CDS01 [Anthostomella pinea]